MAEVEDSAAQCDRDGLRPVTRSKLAEDVLNMCFDGARGRTEAVADFFIAKTVGDMDQDFCFAGGQSDFREVLNQLLRNLRGDVALASLNSPNCADEIRMNDLFKEIATDAGF